MKLTLRLVAVSILVSPLLVSTAFAQDGYFFREPRVSLSLRVGAAAPAANDDLFNFFTDELTLERGDFEATSWGGDLGIRVHSQVEAAISASVARSTTRSESREWEHENDTPIEQTTRLTRVPVTAGLKFYPLSQGRTLGKYAWVPTRRFTPYVGAAAGLMWYNLEQEGEFVDEATDPNSPDIFSDFFKSDGTAPTGHLFGGAELWLIPRVGLNVEGRYAWAKADLYDAFQDFERIDLRGWQVTTGLTVRF
jgi:hypothetical protein